jgi:sugar/nucleoside kinase (ribokinase family)
MDRTAPWSPPARHTGRVVLVGLAILGGAIAAFVARPSLVASAPSSWSVDVGRAGARTGLGEADGVLPDGTSASVFDEALPAVGRLDPELLDALRRAATDAAADGVEVRVNSGWRSPAYQQRLLQDAVVEHGSQDEAERWVATPATSAHVSGQAVDIGPFDAAAWLSEEGAAHGLCQIYGNEPWHYERRPDAVQVGCPPMYADPTQDPRMQP